MDSDENVRWICDTLLSMPDIKVCPHGRPVITELEKRYIDRQFDRIK
jgi:DNA mismatch repair ATPase MutL